MFLFLGLSHPVLAKNNTEKGFFNILNFFAIFFQNFLARVEFERNAGLKFIFLFIGLSHSFLARNNAGMRFFEFFTILFLQFSSQGRLWTEFGAKFFFLSFLAYLIPLWQKIIPERGFLIFWIFLLLFSEFSSLSRV